MGRPARRTPDADQIGREREALELRRAGVTYDVIAERLMYANKGGAHKAVQRALKRTLQEPADELRALELDRLERLQVAVWPKAMRGDVASIDRVLRIAERRSKLLGLDLPPPRDRSDVVEAQGLIQALVAGIRDDLE